MDKIKVLVADDQQILAEGIATILSLEQDIEVVGLVENGQEAYEFVKNTKTDIVLMDIRMPVMNGVDATKLIVNAYPDVKVMILTTFDDDEYIESALKNGASGYMLKDLTADKLCLAIKNIYHGSTVMHQRISQKIISGINRVSPKTSVVKTDSGETLSFREKEILSYIAKGFTNQEIADRLFLSEGTVKNYISLLYEKTGLKGRTRLVNFAIEKGLHEL